MSQFKIYGRVGFLQEHVGEISDALHAAAMQGLGLPAGKRFHRFLALEDEFLRAPDDRSERYLIIECVLFEGRSVATKRAFYSALLDEMQAIGVSAQDLEFAFLETPRHDWLIRGMPGDELDLPYRVEG